MSPRSVALFTEYFLPHFGGIELHVHALARNLQERGVEVTVITPFPGASVVDGVDVLRLDVPLLPFFRTVFTPAGAASLDDLLRSGRFDLLHCHHSVYSPATACAAFLAQRAGLPTVFTFHSILDGYTNALGIFDSVNGWSRWPVTFTAVSDRIARSLQPLLHAPVPVLPNGIDPAYWQPFPATSSSTFRVTSTMRLVRRKRPRALIDMLAHVRDRLPAHQRLRARIIGDGVERSAIERSIKATGLSDSVELCGRLSQERIRQIYADTDVFVLPTLEESFGIAALEARASGLPVVAMRDTGIATFITHGREGLLAASDAEMVAQLLLLASSPEVRDRIAAHNRDNPPPCDWATVAAQHLDVYERAAEVTCAS